MSDISLHVLDELTAELSTSIQKLMNDAANADGAHPFSESVLIQLRHQSPARHVLAFVDKELAGYAFVEHTEPAPKVELAVAPEFRRHGVGHTLLHHIAEKHPNIQLWAHGENTAAALLAESEGFHRVRTLFQMRRPLLAAIPEQSIANDFSLRPFNLTTDLEDWLECNAAAFAEHPEQGGWTERDIQLRMTEEWFDAQGFMVANHNNRMIGFYWTKVHDFAHLSSAEPVGEIYICGVIPEFQGKGIGSALVVTALKYLRKIGMTSAMLYVDTRDAKTVKLYEKLGFVTWDSDTLYTKDLTQ